MANANISNCKLKKRGTDMTQELDIKGLKRHRRIKKRNRFIKKVLLVLVLISIGCVVFFTRSSWIPFFDGIATRYTVAVVNDGALAEGNFPLKLPSASGYQVGTLESSLAVVDDSHFYIYSADGVKTVDKQHSFAKPVLFSNSKKALLYDMNGKQFQLESKYKTIYKKDTTDGIIFGRIAPNDNVAVVTGADGFVAAMTIYNSTGEAFYTWKSASERIIDVAFTGIGDGCIVTTFGASGGRLVSKLYKLSFNTKEAVWESEQLDTLAISAQMRDDGGIVVFGDTQTAYYDKDGKYISSYNYSTNLVDYDASGSTTALLFRNVERRTASLVIMQKDTATAITVPMTTAAEKVIVDGENVLIMSQKNITAYSADGNVISTAEISDEYTDFYKLGEHIFLLGFTDINRIDFKQKG